MARFKIGASCCALARLALLTVAVGACESDFDLGSNVLWATDHESGDLSGWLASPSGGRVPETSSPMSRVEVVAGPARSGRYSLKLTDLAQDDMSGPGVYRELIAPPDAYYSAWYYIPRLYQTKSQWTIMKFYLSRSDTNPAVFNHGHDLNLRTLPGGQTILYVYSHSSDYLQAPLADPPAFVPVETWFQIEVLFRPRADNTGKLLVWLDDRLVYDLENRVTSGSNNAIWGPCNVGEDVQPFGSTSDTQGEGGAGGEAGEPNSGAPNSGAPSTRIPPELYVDDAAISLRRVTRSGKLFATH